MTSEEFASLKPGDSITWIMQPEPKGVANFHIGNYINGNKVLTVVQVGGDWHPNDIVVDTPWKDEKDPSRKTMRGHAHFDCFEVYEPETPLFV